MADATGTAKLVDADRDFDARGVTTVISRAEVERAVRSEASPELFLDVARRGGTGEADTIRVAWDREDLERLLRTTEAEEVALHFDPKELEQALEQADVEAHGLRERALVLTVAATAAAGFAGQAAAQQVDAGSGQPATPAVHATAPQTEGRTVQEIWASAPASVRKEFNAETAGSSGGGGGIELSSPSPTTAGIAGGVALLITGAGFALRGQRRRTPKSA